MTNKIVPYSLKAQIQQARQEAQDAALAKRPGEQIQRRQDHASGVRSSFKSEIYEGMKHYDPYSNREVRDADELRETFPLADERIKLNPHRQEPIRHIGILGGLKLALFGQYNAEDKPAPKTWNRDNELTSGADNSPRRPQLKAGNHPQLPAPKTTAIEKLCDSSVEEYEKSQGKPWWRR